MINPMREITVIRTPFKFNFVHRPPRNIHRNTWTLHIKYFIIARFIEYDVQGIDYD